MLFVLPKGDLCAGIQSGHFSEHLIDAVGNDPLITTGDNPLSLLFIYKEMKGCIISDTPPLTR